ncbi:hypothetical protein HK096_009829, partial [Nowakowskiella sp. JEL0078]
KLKIFLCGKIISTKKTRKYQLGYSTEPISYEEVPVVREIIKEIGNGLKIIGNWFSNTMSVYLGPIQAKTVKQSPNHLVAEIPTNLDQHDIIILRKAGLVPQGSRIICVPILIFDNVNEL